MVNILLTGVPGVGKTTVVDRVVAHLEDRPGGIITREIRERGRRSGFSIEALDGERRVLASKHLREGPRVGPYRVDVASLEGVGVAALARALSSGRIAVIDEIGKMELISPAMRDMIMRVLDSDLDTVCTLGVSGNPFLDAIRRRSDVTVIQVTPGNREGLHRRVLEMLGSGGPSNTGEV